MVIMCFGPPHAVRKADVKNKTPTAKYFATDILAENTLFMFCLLRDMFFYDTVYAVKHEVKDSIKIEIRQQKKYLRETPVVMTQIIGTNEPACYNHLQ
jgi:hypothetical protein